MAILRVAGAGLAGVLLMVTGCGGSTSSEPESPTGAATPQTSVAAPAGDEQLIRDLLEQEAAAFSAWDLDTAVELTCLKYREEARDIAESMGDFAMLPLLPFLDSEQASSEAGTEMAGALQEEFPTASEDSVNRVADAVEGGDEAAMRAAMEQLLQETTVVTIDEVENLTVTGDTATADVTTTSEMLGQPPETNTEQVPFVREDGEWKDCKDPNS